MSPLAEKLVNLAPSSRENSKLNAFALSVIVEGFWRAPVTFLTAFFLQLRRALAQPGGHRPGYGYHD
jgi:hypothetical protein